MASRRDKGNKPKRSSWPLPSITTPLELLELALLLWVLASGSGAQEAVYEIRDFSGGMVSDFDLTDLDAHYGDLAYNWVINEGRLRTRPGLRMDLNPETWTQLGSQTLSCFRYLISAPNIYGPGGLTTLGTSGYITVAHGLTLGSIILDSTMYEALRTYPSYTPGGGLTIGQGTWSSTWSRNYNAVDNIPSGREDQIRSSGLTDYFASGTALRAAAGNSKGLDPDGDTVYTYPWWFGYIGRYYWRGSSYPVDDFYLYEASLFPPDTVMAELPPAGSGELQVDTILASTLEGNYANLTPGRYWFKICYEYDGYQYSAPVGDSTWYVDVPPAKNGIHIRVFAASYMISKRVTAIIVFSSNAVGAYEPYVDHYRYVPSLLSAVPGFAMGLPMDNVAVPVYKTRLTGVEGVDWANLQFYYRGRFCIADADTAQLGHSRSDGKIDQWVVTNLYGLDWEMDTYLFWEDFDPGMINMWDYINQSSTENIVLPRCMAQIGGQVWAGDVLIDNPYSRIHQRYRNAIVLSSFLQPDAFPINNSLLVGSGGGSQVTAIKEWQGKALVWTNDGFEIWNPGLTPQRVNQFKDMGCNAPGSIQVTPQGVFWANANGIYRYTAEGFPQNLTRPVRSEYDSIVTAMSIPLPFDSSGVLTFPLTSSLYLPDRQLYGLVHEKGESWGSWADTLEIDWLTWGSLEPPRRHGGHDVLLYDLNYESWSEWEFGDFLTGFFTGEGSRRYVLSRYSGFDYINEFAQGAMSWMDIAHLGALWSTGWKDLGLPGVEKEIQGIQLDYCLPCTTTSGGFSPCKAFVDVYTDGREQIYEAYQFYASDSLSTGGSAWRRVQYVASDSVGMTVKDPSYGLPVLYKFVIRVGNPTQSGLLVHDHDINAMRVYFKARHKRR